MVSKDNIAGNCLKCDFYRDDRCFKAEKIFSQVTDPICLAKIQTMLLRDIALTLQDYVYEDEDENK